MNLKHLLFLSIILVASSCAIDDEIPTQTNPCEDEFIGSFDLLDTSSDVFPYLDMPEETKFIFINDSGEEVTYTIESAVSSNFASWRLLPCPLNEFYEIKYDFEYEGKSLNLKSEDTTFFFTVNLFTKLDFLDPTAGNVSDVFSIYSVDTAAGFADIFRMFELIVDKRTSTSSSSNSEPEYFESIEINNKLLTDVYKTNFSDLGEAFYYSYEDGIVAFLDTDDVQWVLDRIE